MFSLVLDIVKTCLLFLFYLLNPELSMAADVFVMTDSTEIFGSEINLQEISESPFLRIF